MSDEIDLSAYEHEMQEIRDWLADGPKSADDFDLHFSTSAMLRRGIRCTFCGDNTPILGSMSQGTGPYTWAGRLDLLQLMAIVNNEITSSRKQGKLWYHLRKTTA